MIFKVAKCVVLQSNLSLLHWQPLQPYSHLTQPNRWSFPVRISSVSLAKSEGNSGFGHIYWRILNRKLHFLDSVRCYVLTHFKSLFHFYTPLKILENQGFLDIFGGYRDEILTWNGNTVFSNDIMLYCHKRFPLKLKSEISLKPWFKSSAIRKQPLQVFYKKGVHKYFDRTHRKTPVSESLFLKERLWHRCFFVNVEKILTHFSRMLHSI